MIRVSPGFVRYASGVSRSLTVIPNRSSGPVFHRTIQRIISSGFSSIALKVSRKAAPVAPSTTRWSHDMVTRIRFRITTSPSTTTGFSAVLCWRAWLVTFESWSIGAYVPQHWFMQFLGPDMTGVSLTLLFATVIEVCSEGTSPIAFEIYDNVGVLGNPFVFLMAGVATDYTEIGLLWTNIGKRTALWLPIVAVPQIVALGVLFNSL